MTQEQRDEDFERRLRSAVGSRVTQERNRLGFTKEQLASRSGLASRYLWRVEAGRQNLQLATIAKIAAGLDLPLAALLAGVEEMASDQDVDLDSGR